MEALAEVEEPVEAQPVHKKISFQTAKSLETAAPLERKLQSVFCLTLTAITIVVACLAIGSF